MTEDMARERQRVGRVRLDWPPIIARATGIVRSYDTRVTLRQLFYRLVSEQLLPNTTSAYKVLSDKTAALRRLHRFPTLLDRGREIYRPYFAHDAADAIADVVDVFRLDRTRDQDASIYLGVEKAGLVVQLTSWFETYGLPVLALGGYSSQTYCDQVRADVRREQRPAILLYAGDFDPSGEDIDRDFVDRTQCWDKVIRVALDAEQVRAYGLPPNPGKTTDSRAAGFIMRHGELVQVELDALPPEILRTLFADEIARHLDTSIYEAVLDAEAEQRAALEDFAAGWSS